MIIGITGKSGSGKSTIAETIRKMGYKVIDVDKIHKRLAKENNQEIIDVFIRHKYSIENSKEMIKIFFKDIELRNNINKILFPKVSKKISELLETKDSSLIFLDAPLLFDMKLDYACDKIWYVSCGRWENIKRLKKRNNLSFDDAYYRYNAISFGNINIDIFDLVLNTKYNNTEALKERIKQYKNK